MMSGDASGFRVNDWTPRPQTPARHSTTTVRAKPAPGVSVSADHTWAHDHGAVTEVHPRTPTAGAVTTPEDRHGSS